MHTVGFVVSAVGYLLAFVAALTPTAGLTPILIGSSFAIAAGAFTGVMVVKGTRQ